MRHRVAVFILIIFSLLSTNCFKSKTNTELATEEAILILGNSAEPKTLDPQLATGVVSSRINMALMEGLTLPKPGTSNEIEPGVAESWEHSADATQWTFHLRENAKWSNGDPVTAQDFVYSMNRILSPKLGSSYADLAFVIKSAKAFHSEQIADFSQVGIKALDDHTLQYNLEFPLPEFYKMLSHNVFAPVHPPTIEKFGGMNNLFSQWTLPGNFVGNGPFNLAEWKGHKVIIVKKSPTYWDRHNVRLNEIHFIPEENANSEERAFRAGQIHVTASHLPPNKVEYYKTQRPDIFNSSSIFAVYFYRFNAKRKPLDDKRVRQALSLAIDREAIVKYVVKGEHIPAYGYTPDFFDHYNVPHAVSYNPEKAKKLLAQAGYPNGKDFPELSILFNTLDEHKLVAEAIQQMWKNTLNIKISLFNQEWKVFLSSVSSFDFDIARSGWVGDYLHPLSMIGHYTTGDGNNLTGWSNEVYDDLIYRARKESDIEKEYALLNQAETLLLEEMPITPLYWYVVPYLKSPNVKGWNQNVLEQRNYKYVYLER